MQVFHLRYRNTQGTLMRILNAASRRALELPCVQAIPFEESHQITLALDVTPKQVGQLRRDWYAIVDVTDVRTGVPCEEIVFSEAEWARVPRPPVTASLNGNSGASAATA